MNARAVEGYLRQIEKALERARSNPAAITTAQWLLADLRKELEPQPQQAPPLTPEELEQRFG